MWKLSDAEEAELERLASHKRLPEEALTCLLAKAILEIRGTVTVRADLEFGRKLDTFRAGPAPEFGVTVGGLGDDEREEQPEPDPPSAWWLTHPLVERIAEAISAERQRERPPELAAHADSLLGLERFYVRTVFRALILSGYAVVKPEELRVRGTNGPTFQNSLIDPLLIERQANDLPAQVIAGVTERGKVISLPS